MKSEKELIASYDEPNYPLPKYERNYDYYLSRMKQDNKTEEAALDKQVGGEHYKECGIQPVEYIHANKLDYFEGNVIKYITRHRTKGEGRKDIEKAIHYAELILDLYYK
jgi:hypothetical protein